MIHIHEKKIIKDYIKILLEELTSGNDMYNGFYNYELPLFWYRSPGRTMGNDGDPGRPADAQAYIGQTYSKDDSSDSGESEVLDAMSEPGEETKI